MMKPKAVGPHEGGLLEYLEDIIGTDRYVPQIEAGAKRYSMTRMHQRVLIIRCRLFLIPCPPTLDPVRPCKILV